MDHGEEASCQFVVPCSDTAEMLQLGEEALDQVALAIEALAEARFPLPVPLGGNVGRRTVLLDQLPDSVGIVGLVGQDDNARAEMVEQSIGNLAIVRLSRRQAVPDREPLRVDDDVDFGREATSAATETIICAPLFAVTAC